MMWHGAPSQTWPLTQPSYTPRYTCIILSESSSDIHTRSGRWYATSSGTPEPFFYPQIRRKFRYRTQPFLYHAQYYPCLRPIDIQPTANPDRGHKLKTGSVPQLHNWIRKQLLLSLMELTVRCNPNLCDRNYWGNRHVKIVESPSPEHSWIEGASQWRIPQLDFPLEKSNQISEKYTH